MAQPQLFDAGGPIKVGPRSHKRGAQPVLRRCTEPGCTKMRRLVQGARYCEDHARSCGYAMANKAPVQQRTCHCGRTFTYKSRLAGATASAWYEFCPACHHDSPLTLSQLKHHHVPAELVREWLRLGPDLGCAVCGRRFHRPLRPYIDHDHNCCKGHNSCGRCVRAVLCSSHNTAVGFVEALEEEGLLPTILALIGETPPVSLRAVVTPPAAAVIFPHTA
jgi:hypothetical protein